MSFSTTNTTDDYSGDGATLAFTVTFALVDGLAATKDHIEVYSDGAKKTRGTDYTVTLNADQAASPGGTVTYVTAPATDVKVHLRRRVPVTQPTVYPTTGTFPAKTVEKDFDLRVMAAQERKDPNYFAAPQTVTASTILMIAHGLTDDGGAGLMPSRVQVYLRNVTTEAGWAADEEVYALSGVGLSADATNILVLQDTAFTVPHKTTGAATTLTPASWKWIVEAWL